jgi:STE24 endopeptidase
LYSKYEVSKYLAISFEVGVLNKSAMDIVSKLAMEVASKLKDYPVYTQSGMQTDNKDSASSSNILLYTLAFAVVMFVLEYYLDIRQLFKFLAATSIPPELKHELISEEFFKKSLSYGKDKFSFGLIESLLLFAESVAMILLGYLPFAWDVSSSWAASIGLVAEANSSMYKEIVISSVFVLVLSLHDTVVSLPFSLYRTFVIEQIHGFNKTTVSLFFRDKLLSLVLTLVIGSPILSALIYIVRWGGEHFYLYVWVFLCVMSILLMTIYPTLIAPLFNKYTKLDKGELYEAVEALAKRVSFPLTQIFLVDGSKRSAHSNAYFYGFFKNKRIVLFDTLISQVTQPELLAILGHEIGHWALWHTAQGFVITQLYIFVLFLTFSFVQNTPALFSAFGFTYTSPMPVLIGLVLFTQTFWSPVDKLLTLVMNINSRRNEFAADRYAAALGMGTDLGEGLVKISVEVGIVPYRSLVVYLDTYPPLYQSFLTCVCRTSATWFLTRCTRPTTSATRHSLRGSEPFAATRRGIDFDCRSSSAS